MKNKIVFLIILLFISMSTVSAKCDYKTISNLKQQVNNVNISYTHRITSGVSYFDVTLTNLTNDIYFIDEIAEKTYKSNNGEIILKNYSSNQVKYKFYSAKAECYGTYLGVRFISFPIYNVYYNTGICTDYEHLKVCNKWVSVQYTYDDVRKYIEEYEKEDDIKIEDNIEHKQNFLDKLIQFYIKYYYIILVFIILVGGVIIVTLKRRTRVDLKI